MANTHQEMRFYRSFWKLLFYFLLVLVPAAGCALAAVVEFELPAGHFRVFWLTLAGAAFFGLGALVMLCDLVWGGRYALILRPSGLTDEREGRCEIPWSLVDTVYEVKASTARFICLRLRSAAGADEGGASNDLISRSVRLWRGGGDVAIHSSRLNVGHDELLELITGYWQAAPSALTHPPQNSSRAILARANAQFGRRARA